MAISHVLLVKLMLQSKIMKEVYFRMHYKNPDCGPKKMRSKLETLAACKMNIFHEKLSSIYILFSHIHMFCYEVL
jgi:hypothetical protein